MSKTTKFTVRYVPSLRRREVLECELSSEALYNSRTLAKALRDAGVLPSGTRLRTMRIDGDKVIAFPAAGCLLHTVILTSEPE